MPTFSALSALACQAYGEPYAEGQQCFQHGPSKLNRKPRHYLRVVSFRSCGHQARPSAAHDHFQTEGTLPGINLLTSLRQGGISGEIEEELELYGAMAMSAPSVAAVVDQGKGAVIEFDVEMQLPGQHQPRLRPVCLNDLMIDQLLAKTWT